MPMFPVLVIVSWWRLELLHQWSLRRQTHAAVRNRHLNWAVRVAFGPLNSWLQEEGVRRIQSLSAEMLFFVSLITGC